MLLLLFVFLLIFLFSLAEVPSLEDRVLLDHCLRYGLAVVVDLVLAFVRLVSGSP